MAKRDYYEILGVAKTASKAELKSAYRKMAKQFHPDRNKAADAEEKFKEVQEAYEILSDDQKRSAYDKYGHAGTQGFGGYGDTAGFNGAGFDFSSMGGFGDIFEQFFGGSMGGFGFNTARRNGPEKGQDIQVSLKLEFEEAVFGVEKLIKYRRRVPCEKCKGTGAKGGKVTTCPTCKGQGRVTAVQRTILGNIQTVTTCPQCEGSGQVSKEKCEVCNGRGSLEQDDTFKIKIPQGVPDDVTLRFQDRGHTGSKGGNAGDLYVVIEVKAHPSLERRGNDIYTDIEVDVPTAVLGGTIEIPTVHGNDNLTIPAGTQPEAVLKMSGKGGPKFRGNGNGDQYVKVFVKIPTRISKDQRKLWEELSGSKNPGRFGGLF